MFRNSVNLAKPKTPAVYSFYQPFLASSPCYMLYFSLTGSPKWVFVKRYSTEINESTAGTSDGNYIDKEAQLVKRRDVSHAGQSLREPATNKPPEENEQEALASLSRSSSSEGIWPSSDAVQRGYRQQRTSTVGMTCNVCPN